MSEKQEIRKSGQCLRREVRKGEVFRPTVNCGVVTPKDRCLVGVVLRGHPVETPEGGWWWWDGGGVPFKPDSGSGLGDEVVDLVPDYKDPGYDVAGDQVLLDRYTGLQREHSKLSAADKARASELWSAALRAKVAASKAEEERKERERVVVDDDRWEID